MIDPLACDDLLTFRLRLGLTLRQFSQRTGLSIATLHRVERKKTHASPRTRVRLQNSLELTTQAIEHLLEARNSKFNMQARY